VRPDLERPTPPRETIRVKWHRAAVPASSREWNGPSHARMVMVGAGFRLSMASMPAITRFLGITIWMYHNDHRPAHFHAGCSGDEVLIYIETLGILEGEMAPRIIGLVLEWASRHQDELRENWKLARAGRPLRRIAPLE